MVELIIGAIIGFIVLLGLTILCFKMDDVNVGPFWVLGIIIIFMLCFWVIAFAIIIPCYGSAQVKTELLNEKYGTEYTVNEIFWASGTVDKLIRTEKNLKDNNQKIELEINNK